MSGAFENREKELLFFGIPADALDFPANAADGNQCPARQCFENPYSQIADLEPIGGGIATEEYCFT